jgi:2-aminoadipate transaminase
MTVSQSAVAMPMSARAARTTESPISWLMGLTVGDPEILSLAAGFVDTTTLPNDLLGEAWNDLFGSKDRAQSALQYGITPGSLRLREAMAARLTAQGVPHVDPHLVCISNGGQQSLYTITDVMVDPGDIVLVEDPTYFVYMDVLRSAGAHVLGVTTDDEGMVPEALQARFDEIRRRGLRDRLRILYIMSYYSNPKGCHPGTERRRALWDIFRREAEEHGPFLLLEDASYRDLKLDDGPDEPYIKSWDEHNEWVFLCGTFSKAFAPGLRLGWSHMPRPLFEKLTRMKGNQDFGSSNLNQSLMAHLMENGAFDIAAARFRARYGEKQRALAAAVKEFWPADVKLVHARGGLYLWAELPGINTDPDGEFFRQCLARKVIYVPGQYAFCEQTQGPRPNNTMRLCYGYIDIEPMREAVRRMGEVIAAMRRR